jgi:uncharacterized membrane protein YphA (DoxX/SURF4 family)
MLHNAITWISRLIAALIMLQTLFYKFSGAEESIEIFSRLGVEPLGRYFAGFAELVASLLILVPRTSVYGALMAIGIMLGAIMSHIFVLGIEVGGDNGRLFIYACIVLLTSSYIAISGRQQFFRTFLKTNPSR